jgi:hypothetical protein
MADERIMTTEGKRYPPMFEVITEEEARKRLRTVRLDATLEQYRQRLEAGLEAIQQGKRFHVRPPSQDAAEERTLKAAIKRVAKGNPFNMDVRFDRATEGFIVRLATAQEQQLAIARGRMLTAARNTREKEQLKIAQSIMAQPVSPEGVETGENPFAERTIAEQAARRSRRQQQALSPGAEDGEGAVSEDATGRADTSRPRRRRR